MKHLYSILIILFCSLYCFGQKVEYSVKGGLSISKPKGLHSYTGFNAGIGVSYPLSSDINHAFLDAQIRFTAKGWKDDIYTDYETGIDDLTPRTWKCDLYYIEIPLHIGYKLYLADDYFLISDIGPFLSVGLSGKSIIKGYENKQFNIDNVFSENIYRRFDYGIDVNIGIEKGHWQILAGYNRSLTNPIKDYRNTPNFHNRTVNISIAYIF